MRSMKQVEPNPLQRELARGPQAGPHPDADLLTGFAEGSLLEREREEIFLHLAGCAECRELLSVAMGAVAKPVDESKPFLVARSSRSPVRTWLPWASVAAGIVLVCTVGLLYRQRLEMQEPAGTENTAETLTASQPMPPAPADRGSMGTASAAKPNAGKLKNVEPEQDANEMTPAAEETTDDAKQTDASGQNSQSEAASAGAASDKATAVAQAPTQAQARSQVEAQARPQPQVQAKAQAQAQFESQPQAQAQVEIAPAFAAREPARALGKLSVAAASARPNWRIDSTGAVERTLGEGVWQKVLTDEKTKMRVVSVSNSEVWVGGDNARLYHSADGGDTWSAVMLPVKNGRDHAIAHISFQTRQAGVVQADDGTSWSTADGGVSWK
jgi:hypothetical protein